MSESIEGRDREIAPTEEEISSSTYAILTVVRPVRCVFSENSAFC